MPINSDGKTYGGALHNGKFVANAMGVLRREVDPTGAIVEHRVRKSAYVHERLHSTGKLAHELYDAAEKFRLDFERAQLSGKYARLGYVQAAERQAGCLRRRGGGHQVFMPRKLVPTLIQYWI